MIEELKERAAKENILNGYEHESVLSSGENFNGTDSSEVEAKFESEHKDSGESLVDELTTDESLLGKDKSEEDEV